MALSEQFAKIGDHLYPREIFEPTSLSAVAHANELGHSVSFSKNDADYYWCRKCGYRRHTTEENASMGTDINKAAEASTEVRDLSPVEHEMETITYRLSVLDEMLQDLTSRLRPVLNESRLRGVDGNTSDDSPQQSRMVRDLEAVGSRIQGQINYLDGLLQQVEL